MRTGGRQNFCRPPVRIALDDEKWETYLKYE